MVYDRIAARYDRLMAPLERGFLQRWRREALAELPAQARILEIGAGTGANFSLYPAAALAVASEFSAGMQDISRQRAGSIELIGASVEDLPFASESFDAVFATLVFCSVADPLRGMRELRRVVRPGGRLVLLEHVRPSGVLGFLFDGLNVITTALIQDCFNRRTKEIVRDAGFVTDEIRVKLLGAFNLIVAHRD